MFSLLLLQRPRKVCEQGSLQREAWEVRDSTAKPFIDHHKHFLWDYQLLINSKSRQYPLLSPIISKLFLFCIQFSHYTSTQRCGLVFSYLYCFTNRTCPSNGSLWPGWASTTVAWEENKWGGGGKTPLSNAGQCPDSHDWFHPKQLLHITKYNRQYLWPLRLLKQITIAWVTRKQAFTAPSSEDGKVLRLQGGLSVYRSFHCVFTGLKECKNSPVSAL